MAAVNNMDSRIAIVDLGTNTFHLMIVDLKPSSYEVVFRDRKAVKIGMRGINSDLVTGDALQRALSTLKSFKSVIDAYHTTKIFAFGTSAIRNASNQQEVLTKIKTETGIDVKVISGEEEARLIYLGVRTAVPMGSEKSLIMDIGGGSVEFIIGNNSEIFWKQSFEIGAQRMIEKFHQHDPIQAKELENINNYFDNELSPLLNALKQYHPTTLIGSSGTFDTLSDIYCIKEGLTKNSNSAETPLSFDGFNEIYGELLVKDRSERMKIPGMIELRVDMIVVACTLIDYLLKKYHFQKIRVSNYSLKEGVLADIINANL